MSTPESPIFHAIFNTQAADPATIVGAPPDGVMIVTGKDEASDQDFVSVRVKVSNHCP